MFVDQSVGAAITMFMQGTQKERPLTHDLLANVLRALRAKIDRVVVNDLKDGTYFARLVLSAENENATEEDHRDRCAAQRLYRHGDSRRFLGEIWLPRKQEEPDPFRRLGSLAVLY
jgi:hypothetical protein